MLLTLERFLPATAKLLCSVGELKCRNLNRTHLNWRNVNWRNLKRMNINWRNLNSNPGFLWSLKLRGIEGLGGWSRGKAFWSDLTKEIFSSVAISLCRKITFVYRANEKIRGWWERKVPVVPHYNSEILKSHLSLWNLQFRNSMTARRSYNVTKVSSYSSKRSQLRKWRKCSLTPKIFSHVTHEALVFGVHFKHYHFNGI